MLDRKFKIKDSVDIYTYPSHELSSTKIQFYKINTREKITIEIDKGFLSFLSSTDGIKSSNAILQDLDLNVEAKELEDLLEFMLEKDLIKDVDTESDLRDFEIKFDRQINYFDDLVPHLSGVDSQSALLEKKIAVVGVGATGSAIAAQLVRAGIKHITLIDYKTLDKSHIGRHIYSSKENLYESKVDAFKKYLLKIDSSAKVSSIQSKILPDSDLSELISEEIDLVINTADEPYIGYTTLKLGRYTWDRGIAMYVSGGFDAHLMSSGELIARGLTPCADCCAKTFQNALKDWQPKYSNNTHKLTDSKKINKHYLAGGAGGLFQQSLFSSSLGAMNIIDYFLGNTSEDLLSNRGEYLLNRGHTTWFKMEKQKECIRCGE